MSGRPGHLPKQVTRLDKKKKGRSLLNEQGKMHAKRSRYCSSELKFTWTVQTQSKKMHGAGGEENRPGNERTTVMFEGLLASPSVLPFASALSPYSLLAFFFWVSPLQSSFLSLSTDFLHFLLPCSADFICKKWKQRPKGSPCWFMVSLLFFVFPALSLFFFSSSVPFSVFSFSPSLVIEMDEDNGTAASAHSRWSLLSGTVKTMATPVDDLCSFSFLLLMLFVEMMRETTMKTCNAGWVHAPASVFFCFWQWRSAFFFLLFLSLFFSPLSCPFSLFFSSSSSSLQVSKGFI